MKKVIRLFVFLALFLFLAACSSSSESEESKMSSDSSAGMDSGEGAKEEISQVSLGNSTQQDKAAAADTEGSSQMVIYQASLQLRVKKFEETLQNF